jgi:hypothetical protein
MISKEIKIQRVEKSYKFEGYCFITTIDGEVHKRRYYEKKLRNLFVFKNNLFEFNWGPDGKTAINIKWIGGKEAAQKVWKEENEKQSNAVTEKTTTEIKVKYTNGEVKHKKYELIKTCIEQDIPVFLVGPAGSGKNHTLEQIAKELGLDFYFTNSIQQEYKLTGFIDAGGNYHETEFYKAFKNGGIFFLDEIDASIPEVLVLLNAAIANKYFEFPNGKINAHPNFRVVAAGNTVGSGADEQYTGRTVLDQATLDRFVIIEFDYDINIELHLAKGDVELVDFIHDIRQQAKENGIRATFSYRCITMITKLKGLIDLKEVLIIAVFKGLDKDTINTFRVNGNTQYHEALKEVQQVS